MIIMVNKRFSDIKVPRSGRWEHGSEFHWISDWPTTTLSMPWDGKHLLFGFGRHAFQSLLIFGSATRNWRRLWVPSYFCQEVVASFLSTNLELTLYPDCPGDARPNLDEIKFRPGDVLLLVNFFGLRSKPIKNETYHSDIEVIENHTHDPWSEWARTSNADWCLASLRKTLPLPDGAVLWSPAGHPLPPMAPPTPNHDNAALEKFAAMVLKDLYLNGHPIEKDIFRKLWVSGEQKIATGGVSGMTEWTSSLLRAFPITLWRDLRQRNHQAISARLANLP